MIARLRALWLYEAAHIVIKAMTIGNVASLFSSCVLIGNDKWVTKAMSKDMQDNAMICKNEQRLTHNVHVILTSTYHMSY